VNETAEVQKTRWWDVTVDVCVGKKKGEICVYSFLGISPYFLVFKIKFFKKYKEKKWEVK
jgi:hypothetical protein